MTKETNSDVRSELADSNTDDFLARLRLVIGEKSVNSFAQLCDIKESTFRRYLLGSIPSADKAAVIAKVGNVNLEWLATGCGPMERTHATNVDRQDQGSSIESEFALIPGYSVQVSAGSGAFPDHEQPSRRLAFRHKWLRYRGLNEKDLVLVFAKGDSMEPTIEDNNTLMIDTSQRELNDGAIYVIRSNDHLIVKRVQRLLNQAVLLISDNRAYQPIQVNLDTDDLQVIGRVVWIGKDV